VSARVGAAPALRAVARSEVAVVTFLAFVSVLMAFGIDAALPAFDELRRDFGLDALGLSPAITAPPTSSAWRSGN
jgi:DHA1 family bicyclomycin/chloramphenicol resistance-like MFS transporter